MTRWAISEEERRCGACGAPIVEGEPFQVITLPGVSRPQIRCWDDQLWTFDPVRYAADVNAAWLARFARRQAHRDYRPARFLPPRRPKPRDGKWLAVGADA